MRCLTRGVMPIVRSMVIDSGFASTETVRLRVLLASMRFSFIVTSKARHHSPRIQRNRHAVLRMKAALFAVGCMPLLDGGR